MSLKGLSIALLIIIIMVLSGSIYTVNQAQQAIVVRLGKIQDVPDPDESDTDSVTHSSKIINPGLHFKMPFIDKVYRFDMRLRVLAIEKDDVVTEDRQTVNVSAFINWKIKDLMKFYLATGMDKASNSNAESKLAVLVQRAIRDEFGKLPLTELVAGKRVNVMAKIQSLATDNASTLGITVVDVRINKIALPQATLNRVYNNMRTEFSTQATKIRAQGTEQAEKIKADADRTKIIILAKAREQAANSVAAGQAESAKIYANAYQQSPDFYEFYRSLEAYQNIFTDRRDTFVLNPSSQFFKYFNNAKSEIN